MMIRTLLTAALLAATTLPAMAAGIAVVDTQNILTNANAAKRAVATLNKQRDDSLSKINSMDAQLLDKQKKLMEQRAVMGADKLSAAEEALKKDVMSSRAQVQTMQENFDREALKARQSLNDAIRLSVAEIAKEKSYDAVINKGVVLYTGAGVTDITADVLARTNAKLDK